MLYSKKPYRYKHDLNTLASILNISKGKLVDFKKIVYENNINLTWKKAIKEIYKDASCCILENTNSVSFFLDNKTGAKTYAVYLSNSLIYSDIDSRQELIKLSLQRQGLSIDIFKIFISKFEMAKRFPFR